MMRANWPACLLSLASAGSRAGRATGQTVLPCAGNRATRMLSTPLAASVAGTAVDSCSLKKSLQHESGGPQDFTVPVLPLIMALLPFIQSRLALRRSTSRIFFSSVGMLASYCVGDGGEQEPSQAAYIQFLGSRTHPPAAHVVVLVVHDADPAPVLADVHNPAAVQSPRLVLEVNVDEVARAEGLGVEPRRVERRHAVQLGDFGAGTTVDRQSVVVAERHVDGLFGVLGSPCFYHRAEVPLGLVLSEHVLD